MLQSELCQQKIFHWDEVEEKEIKKDIHQLTDKIICSKKTIDELIICEYRYRTYSN